MNVYNALKELFKQNISCLSENIHLKNRLVERFQNRLL